MQGLWGEVRGNAVQRDGGRRVQLRGREGLYRIRCQVGEKGAWCSPHA
jgi:hypothetical protein